MFALFLGHPKVSTDSFRTSQFVSKLGVDWFASGDATSYIQYG
jgi:hypothetical protein